MTKVVLGFSGGVDSAVSAELLKQQGFQVLGLYLDNAGEAERLAAQEAAELRGIELEVLDVHRQLEEQVCRPFSESYLRGETPNPCIICNPRVKFRSLLDCARRVGAEFISTGHYARSEAGKIYKGRPSNDQSYMLCRLTREQAEHLLLPLGNFEKVQVRAMAEELKLPSAHKPDSMEIFVNAPEALKVTSYPEGSPVDGKLYDFSYLEKKDKYSMFMGGNCPLHEIVTGAEGKPSLLIIRDSYTDSLIPFLLEDYSEIHVLDLRYYRASLKAYIEQYDFDQVLVCYSVSNFSTDANIFLLGL